jgi:hypothetical protein
MILFGYQTKPKLVARLSHKCEHCKHKTPHAIVKVVYWFNLYFIPLFPFSSNTFAICEECNSRTKLSRENSRELEQKMRKKEVQK